MLEKQQRPERRKGEAAGPEKAFEHIDDPILRKLRYPDKGVHRVKFEHDELIVTSEKDRD